MEPGRRRRIRVRGLSGRRATAGAGFPHWNQCLHVRALPGLQGRRGAPAADLEQEALTAQATSMNSAPFNAWKLVSLSPLSPWALAGLLALVAVGVALAGLGLRREPALRRRMVLWALRLG